jgi:Uma2 family endonuclease
MSASQLKELLEDRAMVVPLSVEQYHRMIDTGILPSGEPIELLDGFLVRKDRSSAGADPMTVGPPHSWVIAQLVALCAGLEIHGCHLRVQQPLTLPPDDEPEPDGAIVRGPSAGYRNSHPGAADVICLIEVADSSLQRDRVTKRRIYADAGIPLYVIINLVDGMIEVHSEPQAGEGRYALTKILEKNQTLRIACPDGHILEFPVAGLLP